MDSKRDSKGDLPLEHSASHIEVDEKQQHVQRDYSGAIVSVDPLEQRLVRKLDWRIMVSATLQLSDQSELMDFQPVLWIMYWLNYLDRNAIALAKLDKIDKDLKLTPTRKLQ